MPRMYLLFLSFLFPLFQTISLFCEHHVLAALSPSRPHSLCKSHYEHLASFILLEHTKKYWLPVCKATWKSAISPVAYFPGYLEYLEQWSLSYVLYTSKLPSWPDDTNVQLGYVSPWEGGCELSSARLFSVKMTLTGPAESGLFSPRCFTAAVAVQK